MSEHTQETQHSAHHVQPFELYIKVFGALIVLTIITVWIAQFHFGILNGFIAMFVATIKAALVGMYFMNLKHDNKLYAVIIITAVAFLLLLFSFSLFDFDTRVLETSPL